MNRTLDPRRDVPSSELLRREIDKRRAQRLIVVVAVALAIWLLGVSILNWRESLLLAPVAEAGHAEGTFFHGLMDECHPIPPPPLMAVFRASRDTTCLDSFVHEMAPEGLRYVAIIAPAASGGVGHDEEVQTAEAGDRLSPPGIEDRPDWRGGPRSIADGARHVYIMPPQTPPDGASIPTVILEYVPTKARAVRRQGLVSLAVGLTGCLGLLGGTLLLLRLDRQRDVAQRRAQEQEKLAILGQMSAVLAHELRNPLASAKGRAELVAELLEPESNLKQRAMSVVGELRRVETVTQQLLDFVRSGTAKRQPCDPVRLAQDAVDRVEGPAELRLEGPIPTWSLDPYAMERCLINLLGNAVQAQQGATEPVILTLGVRDRQLFFSVRDHGPGFPAGVDVVAPFMTTRSGGTGLGLAVCHQILLAHQGTLSLGQAPDGGALVEIGIPPAEDHPRR